MANVSGWFLRCEDCRHAGKCQRERWLRESKIFLPGCIVTQRDRAKKMKDTETQGTGGEQ